MVRQRTGRTRLRPPVDARCRKIAGDMTPDNARRRLLAYLVERLGRAETASRLHTNVASLDAWMSGTEEPPTRSVLALADLVYEMQKREMAK